MKSSSVRELHLKTSEIVRQVVAGKSFIIEKRAYQWPRFVPYANGQKRACPIAKFSLMSGPETMDSGLILEQNRT